MVANRHEFYNTQAWKDFRQTMIAERLCRYGEIICDKCYKPIVNRYDLILHHITMLNDVNYQDTAKYRRKNMMPCSVKSRTPPMN